MRSFWVLLALIFSTIAPAKTVENMPVSDELLELSWLDLIPESERNNFNDLSMPPLEHSGDAALQLKLLSFFWFLFLVHAFMFHRLHPIRLTNVKG